MKKWIMICLFLITIDAYSQERFHVFPQFADGRFPDGSYYRSTITILPWFDSDNPTCSLVLYGMTTTFDSGASGFSFTISHSPGGFSVNRTTGVQLFQGGYATLTCSDYTFAHVFYTFYAANGTKLSEATVFSSGETYQRRIVVDQRDGARLGIAIANNTDLASSYTITATGSFGTRTATVNVPARRALARFVDELLTLPANALGVITIRQPDFSDFYLIGLRFTGALFTTISGN